MAAQQRNRITGITVRGIKSICNEQHIDIAPLTILAGANSSGKSSIMQPLLLLKQTLEASGDPGPLLLEGPNVRFTKAEQLLSRISGKTPEPEFSLKIDLSNNSSIQVVFRREKDKGFDLIFTVYRYDKKKYQLSSQLTSKQLVNLLFPDNVDKLHNLSMSVDRRRCFFVPVVSDNREPFFSEPDLIGGARILNTQLYVSLIQDIVHLPGLRGNPQRTYPKTGVGSGFPGTFDQYAASVIADWQDKKAQDKMKMLAGALETLGLTWNVKAQRISDTQVELQVGRLSHPRKGGARDLVSVADVGFGLSQSLPVLVALIVAKPGQMVYLEQPEIHLHPLAQRKLAHVLADAVKRGVIIVIETHSPLLLREVQTLIALDKISPNDVKLHWFQRDKNGCTTVETAAIDDTGAYGTWPVDFDITELESEDAYLNAVESRTKGKK
jgi:predicted ATPase